MPVKRELQSPPVESTEADAAEPSSPEDDRVSVATQSDVDFDVVENVDAPLKRMEYYSDD